MRTGCLAVVLIVSCTRATPSTPSLDPACSLTDALDAGGCLQFLLRPGCLEPEEVALRTVPVVVEVDGVPLEGARQCGPLLVAGERAPGAQPPLQLQVTLLGARDGGFFVAQSSLAVNPKSLPPDHHSVRLCGVCIGAVARRADGAWLSVAIDRAELKAVFVEHGW